MVKAGADISNKNILLVVSGGISAYKSVELARLLVKSGANVKVVMTAAGEQFVSALTFRTVTGNPVAVSMWAEPSSPFPHISLSKEADLVVVAPATANILAKMACGIADDLASTTLLSARCPVVVAPAMNVHMYSNFATRRNLRILEENGIVLIGPDKGELACGDEGVGRMSEPTQVFEVIKREISLIKNLSQKSIMVTAGPTREHVDPVRFISNPSSGKMGFAVADRAARRGAKVYLVSGPVEIPTPPGSIVSKVTTAEEMKREVMDKLGEVDALVMAAAVSDFKPSSSEMKKIKKSGEVLKFELEPTEDILKLVSQRKDKPLVVGFAAETHDVIENAVKKLNDKDMDMIVANEVGGGEMGFGADRSLAAIISRGETGGHLEMMSKVELADAILAKLAAAFEKKRRS